MRASSTHTLRLSTLAGGSRCIAFVGAAAG